MEELDDWLSIIEISEPKYCTGKCSNSALHADTFVFPKFVHDILNIVFFIYLYFCHLSSQLQWQPVIKEGWDAHIINLCIPDVSHTLSKCVRTESPSPVNSLSAPPRTHTHTHTHTRTHTLHLADAFIQSDIQLIRLSRRHTPWSNVGLRTLLKGQQLCRSYLGHTRDWTTNLAGPSQVA